MRLFRLASQRRVLPGFPDGDGSMGSISPGGLRRWLVLGLLVFFAPSALLADVVAVAHRGGRVQGPENTLEVFQLTIDLGWSVWLETDSWLSSDGVPVLHHDVDMCRTTNIGSLPGYDCDVAANNPLGRFPWIRDFTLAELKSLDVGSWFSPEFAGTTMPSLEEALTLVNGTGIPLLVEVKVPGQALIIKEILDRTGLDSDNIIIWARQSWSWDLFHGVLPGVRQITGILPISSVTDALLAARAAAGDFGIAIQAVGLTSELVDQIHSYGLIVYSLPGTFGADPVTTQIPKGIDSWHSPDEVSWSNFLFNNPCIDRFDNDADGFADFVGIDVDFDGVPETLPDPGCSDFFAPGEVTECQDLIDNDGDGFVDLADTACVEPNSLSETPSVLVPSLSGLGFLLLGLSMLGLGYIYGRQTHAGRLASSREPKR